MSAYTDMLAMRKRLEALEARIAGFVDNLNACHARLAAQEAEIVELPRLKPAPVQESPIAQLAQRNANRTAQAGGDGLLYAKPGHPHPSVAPHRG